MDPSLAFVRFFIKVKLIDIINYHYLSTCISNSRNMPKFGDHVKLSEEDFEFLQNHNGTRTTRWQDSMDILILRNCHLSDNTTVQRA